MCLVTEFFDPLTITSPCRELLGSIRHAVFGMTATLDGKRLGGTSTGKKDSCRPGTAQQRPEHPRAGRWMRGSRVRLCRAGTGGT
jgi:hypothetical protein